MTNLPAGIGRRQGEYDDGTEFLQEGPALDAEACCQDDSHGTIPD